MDLDKLTDDQLLLEIVTTDEELFRQGVDLRRRPFAIEERIFQRRGLIFTVISNPDPLQLRVRALIESIYRPQDLAMGGHIGAFMYNDIFTRISVPLGYGQFRLNLFDHIDLNPIQKRILNNDANQLNNFTDQFFDVADIQYGTYEIKAEYSKFELVARFSDLSRLHLHAAAAIITGGYDYRGAVQSALLATELSLKATAASTGLSEDDIKNQFGHTLNKIADFSASLFPSFDVGRVKRAIDLQPQYVANRYSQQQPSRLETGNTVMRAQYICSEVIRHISMRNFREQSSISLARSFPP